MTNKEPGLLVLKELEGNNPTHLNPLQQAMEPYTDTLIHFWFTVWCMVWVVLFVVFVREYQKHRAGKKQ